MNKPDLIEGRCGWCGSDACYQTYHDQEWGRLVTDDRVLFEFLILESAQAGLNWLTILKKREGYREAFCQFDAAAVAQMTEKDVEALVRNPGIVRHKQKIRAAIHNARIFLDVQKEFGSFYHYILSFFPDGKPLTNHFKTLREVPTSSPLSDALSQDMRQRGFRFFGTTICYAFLEATGFIDDHLTGCICKNKKRDSP